MNSARPARNRERILEAIDQLRKRKARPDIPRICAYLFRRFHVPSAEARADLEWCVENNFVLKVEYKGNISYRNAAKKWAQMKRREQQHANSNTIVRQASSHNFMELLTHVFGELVVEEPDYLESGVPPKEIVCNILQKDSVTYTKSYIAILLVKEVERGNLVKLSNGNYLLGPCSDDLRQAETNSSPSPPRPDSVKVDISKREEEKVTIVKSKKQLIAKFQAEKRREKELDPRSREGKRQDPGNLRFGGRRKKAKKVFDPSDNHIPKKRGRPAGSLNKATIEKQQSFKTKDDDSRPESRTSTGSRDNSGVCSVCHNQSKKSNDRMVACRECSNKAHYGCLNGEDMMLKMYPDNTWQCPHCKTCVVCYETSDAGNLIVCSVCADGYHASCHQPRVMDKIKNGQRWLCVNCRVSDNMMFNVIQSNIGDVRHRITISDDNDKESPSKANSFISGRSSPYDSSSSSPEADSNLKSDGEADAQSDSGKESDEDSNIDPSIPDATHWTPDEVYQYFAQFFPEEAKVFKEQEIDGRSLLLLKRLDVLTGLKLKLGPALKIYRHVTMLQVRRDDRRLYWL